MSGPLIPYVTLPEIPLDFLLQVPLIEGLFDPAHPPSIKPFGTLVAIGVYVGSVVAVRHAKERGLDVKKMNDFIFWVVAMGFVCGHVLDAIFYHPEVVRRDPTYLLKLWDGLSSFGGFTGAIVGASIWKYIHKVSIFRYTDLVSSAFPLAWCFGRAGCSVAHDHPGNFSDAWYAVQYPLGHGFVGRYDLGLYELLLTIPLAIAFAVLWRKPRNYGFFTGVMCTAYAPVRFFLDFLRAPDDGVMAQADPRYAGLTPAQWAAFGLFGLGVYALRLSRLPQNAYGSPDPDAPEAEGGDDEDENAPKAEAAPEASEAAPAPTADAVIDEAEPKPAPGA